MDVRCPVCDEVVSSGVDTLSARLREHLDEKHDFFSRETEEEREVRTFKEKGPEAYTAETRVQVEEVTQFRDPRSGRTVEEREVATFSGREPAEGPSTSEKDIEAVTKFRKPMAGESKEECVTRTFSSTMCEAEPADSYLLREQVRQWRYPRVGPEGERGPAFLCPVCEVPMAASDEDALNSELKEHFAQAHDLERIRMQMRR